MPRKPSRFEPAIPILIVLVVLAVYGRVVGYAFGAWDDDILVFQNPYFVPLSSLAPAQFWKEPHLGLYMPITYTAWTLLCRLAQLPHPVAVEGVGPIALDATAFHTANLIVHAASTLLGFFLIRRVLAVRTSGPTLAWAAAAGALFFGLHPVQVESVAWISELKGLLAGFFSMAALDRYVRFRLCPDWRRWALSTLLFAAALLSKPSAVGLPLIAVGIDVFFLRSPDDRVPRAALGRKVRPLVPWMALSLIAAWIGHAAQPAAGAPSAVPVALRPLVAFDALAFYLVHVAFPWSLGLDYGRRPQEVLAHHGIEAAWLAALVIAAAVLLQRRRRPYLVGAAFLFVSALAPVLGLVPFDFQAISTVTDRYLYFAMFGPALALAVAIADSHLARRRWVLAAVVAVLLACVVRTSLQLPVWNTRRSLFTAGLRLNPRSWTLVTDLGAMAMNEGRIDEAEEYFRQAVAIRPDDPAALRNLGQVYRRSNRGAEELALYRATAAAPSGAGVGHRLLGERLAFDGNTSGAEAEYRSALQVDGDDAEAHDGLGIVLLKSGRAAAAADEFRAVIRLRPYQPAAYGHLGQALSSLGRPAEAADQERRAIELEPNNPYWYFHRAVALADLGELDGAIEAYRTSIRYKSDLAPARANLAALLGRRGRWEEAVTEWREAVRLDPNRAASRDALAEALRHLGP